MDAGIFRDRLKVYLAGVLVSVASFSSGARSEDGGKSGLSRENLSGLMLMNMSCMRDGDVKGKYLMREYTLTMAEEYPWDNSLSNYTIPIFYTNGDLREKVIGRLEEGLEKAEGNDKAWVLFNLANINRRKGFPPLSVISSESKKAQWRRYFTVPEDFKIPKKVDCEFVRKAEAFYCEGYELAKGDPDFDECYANSFSIFVKYAKRYNVNEMCGLESEGCDELYRKERESVADEEAKNNFEGAIGSVIGKLRKLFQINGK